MSETAKSVVTLVKSLRPWAEPVDVKTTCRPFGVTSAIHWLTALALQLEPDPVICACAAIGVTRAFAVEPDERASAAASAATERAVRRPARWRMAILRVVVRLGDDVLLIDDRSVPAPASA